MRRVEASDPEALASRIKNDAMRYPPRRIDDRGGGKNNGCCFLEKHFLNNKYYKNGY